MTDLTERIKEFESKGWKFWKKQDEALFDSVVTPSGNIFSTEYPWGKGLDACPICEEYMDDNHVEETYCAHTKEDYKEIEEAKEYLDLIQRKRNQETLKYFKFA